MVTMQPTRQIRFLGLLNVRTFSFVCNLLWNFSYWAFLRGPPIDEFIESETGFKLWWYTLRMGGNSSLQSVISCEPARDMFFFSRTTPQASQITSVLQARNWSCILHEVKKKNRESNQGSNLRRNGEKVLKVGFGLDMPFKLADSIDFAEKHTRQSRGIVSNYLKLSTNADVVSFDGTLVVQYYDIMRFMILCDGHHKVSPNLNP